jgi:hypothetical protein
VRRAAAIGVLFLAVIAAPVGAQDAAPTTPSPAAAAKLEKALPSFEDARRALAEKDWDAAVAAYARAAETLGDDASLGGWRDAALYDTACAHARAGRAVKAAEVFAQSVAQGLRPMARQTESGAWALAPGLTLEHILSDADLDAIREEKAYRDALRPYLAAGEPLLEFTRPDTSSLVPAVIVLAADGEDVERALPAWRVAARERRIALVAVAGPVRPTATDRRWILGDGDERWAVAKIAETLDLVAKDARIDGKRVFVVGMGERPGEAAWAAALAAPTRVAGFAAPGARFHAAWHADAIAAVPTTWRVALGATDAEPAKLLKERGIEATRVEPSKDEVATAASVLEALLGKQ